MATPSQPVKFAPASARDPAEGRIGWRHLRREPFRLLFPAAVLAGCVGIGHWLAYTMGLASGYSGSFHASMQVGVYLGAFVAGFLMTALPNFSGAPNASTLELLGVVLLLAAQVFALAIERWIVADVAFGAFLLLLVVFFVRRLRLGTRRVAPPIDFLWLPIAFALGLTGTALVAAGRGDLVAGDVLAFGRVLVLQGFILPLVFGVGGFLIPRLLGRVDETIRFATVPADRAQALRGRRHRLLGIAAIFLVASFALEAAKEVRIAYALRALAATIEFGFVGRILRFPRGRGFRGVLLWSSLWLVLAGLWGPALRPEFRVAFLHLMFIGGFSVMTFAVGAIVTLTHAAPVGSLHRRQWVFRFVGATLALALLARVPADFLPHLYFVHLGSAAACWLAAAIGWLVWCVPIVLRPPAQAAFEKAHVVKEMLRLSTGDPPAKSAD